MNYYINCCSLTQTGECDCESCIYYGGMDHGVVRCLAEITENYGRKTTRERKERKKIGSKNQQRDS